MTYNRDKSIAYAHKWAYSRNPAYYNFDTLGGDCTNFISQCLYSGCGVMNYERDVGWYYKSPNDRAAAWSGVEFFFRFLANNKGAGPYAAVLPLYEAAPGDIIQLSFDGIVYGHSLFVVEVNSKTENGVLIATHTYDSDNRPLSTYNYKAHRLLHIEGVRG